MLDRFRTQLLNIYIWIVIIIIVNSIFISKYLLKVGMRLLFKY